MPEPTPDFASWPDALERLVGERRPRIVDRVAVVAETSSTQDAARRQCAGRPGLLVLAGRQTAGRGRLGRAWADTSHLGLAATFVLPATLAPGFVSLAAGLAAAHACESCLGPPGSRPALGVRWPNDVVDRRSGRKLAGVLIEAADGLLFAGIGVNVLHRADEFPLELRAKGASLAQLATEAGPRIPPPTRLDAARALILALDAVLGREAADIARECVARDTLQGRTASFVHDNQTRTGVVESIDPLGALVLRTQEGDRLELPALATSLVHDSVR